MLQKGVDVQVVGLCGGQTFANGQNGVIMSWTGDEGQVELRTGTLRGQVVNVSKHNVRSPSRETQMRDDMMNSLRAPGTGVYGFNASRQQGGSSNGWYGKDAMGYRGGGPQINSCNASQQGTAAPLQPECQRPLMERMGVMHMRNSGRSHGAPGTGVNAYHESRQQGGSSNGRHGQDAMGYPYRGGGPQINSCNASQQGTEAPRQPEGQGDVANRKRDRPTVDLTGDGTSKKALVVGIAKYDRSPLRCSVNDAKDVHKALKDMGFASTLVTDCTIDEFNAAKIAFVESLGPGDSAIFYFAGHGVEASVHQGDVSSNWLLAKDIPSSNSWLPPKAVNANGTLKDMEGKGTRFNLLILDCCRDNPLPQSSRGLGACGLAPMTPSGSLIAFACAPRKRAAELRREENGLYTKHLLRHIKTKGLTISDLFIRISNGVREESKALCLEEEQDPYVNSALRVEGACLN